MMKQNQSHASWGKSVHWISGHQSRDQLGSLFPQPKSLLPKFCSGLWRCTDCLSGMRHSIHCKTKEVTAIHQLGERNPHANGWHWQTDIDWRCRHYAKPTRHAGGEVECDSLHVFHTKVHNKCFFFLHISNSAWGFDRHSAWLLKSAHQRCSRRPTDNHFCANLPVYQLNVLSLISLFLTSFNVFSCLIANPHIHDARGYVSASPIITYFGLSHPAAHIHIFRGNESSTDPKVCVMTPQRDQPAPRFYLLCKILQILGLFALLG